jgi:hypothetical protein
LLLELKKLLNVWDFMRKRCAEAPPGPRRAARGRHCYDMLVRARPDISWQNSTKPALAQGLDLDRLWDAWGGGGAPFSKAAPWLGDALAGGSLTVPPPAHVPSLAAGAPACLHNGLPPEGRSAFLPFFGPVFGNNFGGPNDVFLMGPWEAMQQYFPRAPIVEALMKARVGFHPEELVRCGMAELLRQADATRRESGAADPAPVLEHVVLDIHYCRHYSAEAAACF